MSSTTADAARPTSVDAAPAPTPAAAPAPSAAPVSAEKTAAPAPGAAPVPAATPASADVASAPAAAEPTPAPQSPAGKAAEDEAPEPQNPLTEKFTAAEWAALKAFRGTLAAALKEAYPERAADAPPVSLWGVVIDPAAPRTARASVVLMKFLRARNLNPTEAHSMLVATLRWRDEFNVAAAVQEEFPQDVFGKLGFVYGKDKHNRPVTYNLYGANKDLKAVFGDVQRFLRWRVALMEKSIGLLDFETVDQTVQVHDYEGVGMGSRDANSKNAASEATSIFQNHYPELLAKKFFINVPSVLSWIFWLFKPLISANTLAKMSVVGSGQHAIAKALLPVIDASELPKRYGGQAEGF